MITWQYLAGFIDGDGWITTSQHKNCSTQRYTVGFTQHARERKFIDALVQFLNNNGVRTHVTARVVKGSINVDTPMINVLIGHQAGIIILMENIAPYMLFKKDKAIECLEYVKGRIDKRGVLFNDAPQEKRRYWRSEELSLLVELQGAGYSNLAIAGRLNRSVDSVAHKLYRLNITRQSPRACHGDWLAQMANAASGDSADE